MPLTINQSLYGKILSILYNIGGKIVVTFNIYEAKSIFQYFVITKTPNMSNEKWKSAFIKPLLTKKKTEKYI